MQQHSTLNYGPMLGISRPQANRAYFFVRWSFYLYAFLMPLEHLDLFGLRGAFTITRMAGVLVALTAFLQPQLCLAKPPKAFWCFFGYLLVSTLIGLVLSSDHLEPVLRASWTLAQNLAVFWICYNLMRDDNFVKWALLSFGAGTVALALFAHLGVSEQTIESSAGARVSGLAENANMFGCLMALGALSFLGLALGRAGVKTIWALLLYAPSMFLIVYTIASGSRGSMLCLAVGLLLLLFRGGKFGTRIKALLLMTVVLGAGAREFLKSDLSRQRWESTLETGELAGREILIAECWKMFREKPIFGWGPVTHLYVLAERSLWEFEMADTHNDLLWVMTSTGLMGTIPFVAGFGLCAWSAWRGRKALQGYLPLVLIVAMMAMTVSGTMQDRKVTWMMAAYAAAAATYVAQPTAIRTPQLRRNGP